MKKTFMSVCLLVCFIAPSMAQNIITLPNDSAFISANVADEFDLVDLHIEVINNTASPTTYTWRMVDYSAQVPPWELKLCDNNNCYDLLLGNPMHQSLSVAAYDTMDMKFQFSPHCVNGVANVNVVVYATNDSANATVTLNYKADLTTSCPTGITQIFSSALNVYPNPVQNSFVVSGLQNAGNLSFEVYDMKGALAKSEVKNATNTTIEISIESLAAGVYVLKAFDSNNKIAVTSRIIKNP